MARVVVSTPADVDIQAAWLHLAEHGIEAADRLVDRFEEVFRQLQTFPYLGEVHPHPHQELRRTTAPPYVIVYKVTGGEVTIVRVLHSARRWEELL